MRNDPSAMVMQLRWKEIITNPELAMVLLKEGVNSVYGDAFRSRLAEIFQNKNKKFNWRHAVTNELFWMRFPDFKNNYYYNTKVWKTLSEQQKAELDKALDSVKEFYFNHGREY